MKKPLAVCLLLMTVWMAAVPAFALEASVHPLVNPQQVVYRETEDEFFNILIAGIDFGNYNGRWGSGGKRDFSICHTDVVMVIAMNQNTREIDLISLPRDTLTYIPGVQGIYKLNAAINCVDEGGDGMKQLCESASWLLGGMPIHKYMAVDMYSLIALVDAIGGVDFNLDMSYRSEDKYYKKGLQHLDGVGVMDYVRARKNATVEGTDLGRTRRGRDMIVALYRTLQEKMEKESAGSVALTMINIIFGGEYNILTNFTSADLMNMASMIKGFSGPEQVGSYVLTGDYQSGALTYWNFNYLDQQHRRQVLRDVYGIEAEELHYTTLEHIAWLAEDGFAGTKYIKVARMLYEYGMEMESLTEHQMALLSKVEAQHDLVVAAFDKAALSHSEEDTAQLRALMKELRTVTNEAAQALKYPRALPWPMNKYWYIDSFINKYYDLKWS